MTPYVKGLHPIAEDVWAWLQPDGSWGWSNAGLVAGQGSSLLVDTLFDLALTQQMLDAMDVVTAPRPITDLVLTHANGDHCYGNELLASHVRIHAAPHVAEEMHEEPPQLLAHLLTQDLGPVLTPYVHSCFGAFHFEDITVRMPDVTIEHETTIEVGGRQVTILPLGPAHTAGDAAVFIPDAGVLFAGDLLFIGGTPIMWAGPVASWIAACDRMTALQPSVVVPGHGPVTDATGIAEVRSYLAYVDNQAREAFDAGKSWDKAALEMDLGPYAPLPDSERVVVTTYNIYRDLQSDLPARTVAELFTLMAEWQAARVD